MRTSFLYLGLFFLVCLAMSCTREDLLDYLDGHDDIKQYQVKLSGDNEVPEVDTRASGQAIFKLSKDGKSLHFKITVYGLEDFLASHIHIASPGENGPVVAFLVPIEPSSTDGPLFPGITNGLLGEGVLTADNLIGPFEGKTIMDLVHEMDANNAYVNLHTSEYPAGEIRGNF